MFTTEKIAFSIDLIQIYDTKWDGEQNFYQDHLIADMGEFQIEYSLQYRTNSTTLKSTYLQPEETKPWGETIVVDIKNITDEDGIAIPFNDKELLQMEARIIQLLSIKYQWGLR